MNLEALENYDESYIILPTDPVPVVDEECEAINNENRCLQQIHSLGNTNSIVPTTYLSLIFLI